MDDYSLAALSDSKNEWCSRLITILTPAVIDGLKSIFTEAWDLCAENDEEEKYLMTFQTFLSRVPKWNEAIISSERERIETATNCGYLEELITCVHIIQLKALTCVRVGTEQKKIDIDIPSKNEFIHRVYVNAARKLYTVVYLFEKDIPPLQVQKNNRELELIVKECVLNSVRDTMPVEKILRAYIDETEEENVTEVVVPVEEEVKEEPKEEVKEEVKEPTVNTESSDSIGDKKTDVDVTEKTTTVNKLSTPEIVTKQLDNSPQQNAKEQEDVVTFNDVDNAMDINGKESNIDAPKTDERLERIAAIAAERRKEEEEEDEDQLTIGQEVKLELNEISDINNSNSNNNIILDDIEVLG